MNNRKEVTLGPHQWQPGGQPLTLQVTQIEPAEPGWVWATGWRYGPAETDITRVTVLVRHSALRDGGGDGA